MNRIFVSHSRRDTDLAPWFDSVFAREQIDAVRFQFEYEARKRNLIEELVQRVESSVALFVLLSPEVIGPTLHTSNWVSAEVGLARAGGIPIWVFERLDNPVGFPVPFVDHYIRLPLGTPESEPGVHEFVRFVIKSYLTVPAPTWFWEGAGVLHCDNQECQTRFQIHQDNHNIDRCPTCCTPNQWDMAMTLCTDCKGKGSVFTLLPLRSRCSNCGGSGRLLVDMGSEPCPSCGGQGRSIVEGTQIICPNCRGTGHQRWELVQP